MEKLDYKKQLKHLYNPSGKDISIVDVPAMNFLMIDGQGDPNSSASFQQAVEALFSFSYAIKFAIKKGPQEFDYGVLPLEGLWWTEDMSQFNIQDKNNWQWTLMIMQPEIVTAEIVEKARRQVEKKKTLDSLSQVRFESYHEGASVQILYTGPFSDEGPTIANLHALIEKQGCQLKGKHHEIYLNDFRKTDPARVKTVIRQPMLCPR